MSKKIKCRLIVHTHYKPIDFGEFESISAAKKYVQDCDIKVYTIKRLK